ncbi:MAG: pyridoxamine 5'-phosphate oxidase [Flavobacteriales bacterium]
MSNIVHHRKSYEKHSLEVEDLKATPHEMLEFWLSEVEELHDFNAMVVSSVDASGQPHSRVVLLRGVNEEGLKFYTNYSSHKGQELEQNNKVALNFFWPTVERQVRVEGELYKLSEAESDAYFNSRPRESQIGAWVSPQSSTIESREVLNERFREYTDKFEGHPVPRPAHWGGYIIRPNYFEFWQGRPNRLHDRLTYRLHDGAWKISRMAP